MIRFPFFCGIAGYGLYQVVSQKASAGVLLDLLTRELASKSALRQLLYIVTTLVFFNVALEPLVRFVRGRLGAKGAWESSVAFFVLKEVRGKGDVGAI
jgi:hypothetical protein